MNTISFDNLLFQTAFCCMASDGQIDPKEISRIQSLCETSPLFKDFNLLEEFNRLVKAINTQGKDFIASYLNRLEDYPLTEAEELCLIDFAVQIIRADEEIKYAEIKFFKNIRHRLKISDEQILEKFPDIEQFLEKDIVTDSFKDILTSQYMDIADIPQFASITINSDFQSISPEKFQFIKDIKTFDS